MKSVQISPWAFFANVRRVDVRKLGIEKGHFETQLIYLLFSKLKGYCEKNQPQELITQDVWNRPASQPPNVAKCETQSGQKKFAQSNCRILHVLRKKRARKTSVVQATLKSRFTLSRAQSLLSRAVGHVWPVNTNSNRANHKLRKKLVNQ